MTIFSEEEWNWEYGRSVGVTTYDMMLLMSPTHSISSYGSKDSDRNGFNCRRWKDVSISTFFEKDHVS
jgi:hypothetical protein